MKLPAVAGAAAIVGLVVVGALATIVNPSPTNAAMTACGANNPSNKVRATVDLPSAKLFWKLFPNEHKAAPELDRDTPVMVVVFDGPTAVGVLAGPDDEGPAVRSVTLDNVVCVYMPPSDLYPYGEPLVYYDVNLDGFAP